MCLASWRITEDWQLVCEPGHRKLSFTLSNVYTQDSRIKNKEICKEKFELTYVCTSERYVHILISKKVKLLGS